LRKKILKVKSSQISENKMAATWNVKLSAQGRTMNVTVQAGTQPEAKKIAEHQHPGYKAVTAQRA
jgi:murein tripeptide amidase MpaA